jgi:hypothetical protein
MASRTANVVVAPEDIESYRHDHGEPEYASADPLAGGTARNLPIWDVDQIAEHLNRTGQSWVVNNGSTLDDGVINYGFWRSVSEVQASDYGRYGFSEASPDTFSAFSEGQKGLLGQR